MNRSVIYVRRVLEIAARRTANVAALHADLSTDMTTQSATEIMRVMDAKEHGQPTRQVNTGSFTGSFPQLGEHMSAIHSVDFDVSSKNPLDSDIVDGGMNEWFHWNSIHHA
jgi:hypothetical protein